jgi:hypothetical protein
MSPDEKQVLVEKIDELPPEQRKRVEGYVDALHEMTQPSSTAGEFIYGSEKEGQASEPVSSEESIDTEEETLNLSLRGALSHLKGEYTAEELQEKSKQWRIKKALDY